MTAATYDLIVALARWQQLMTDCRALCSYCAQTLPADQAFEQDPRWDPAADRGAGAWIHPLRKRDTPSVPDGDYTRCRAGTLLSASARQTSAHDLGHDEPVATQGVQHERSDDP